MKHEFIQMQSGNKTRVVPIKISAVIMSKEGLTSFILWGCIQKFWDWVSNEINNNKHSLRSNTKDYGSKTH